MIDTSDILKKLSYSYDRFSTPETMPTVVDKTFSELFSNISFHKNSIGSKNLYMHQLLATRALKDGKNVILVSGTGSGKTESWVFYALNENKRALVIFPTIALSADQEKRLRNYAQLVNRRVIRCDGTTIKSIDTSNVILSRNWSILITNPAFLLNDLKAFAKKDITWAVISHTLKSIDLLVIDEFDFYDAQSLATLMAIISVISKINPNIQLVILTATLSGTKAIAKKITELTGKKTEIIAGRPFRVKNITYLVRGKNLFELWSLIDSHREKLIKAIPEIEPLIKDKKSVYDNYYLILKILKSAKVPVALTQMMPNNPIELLKEYVVHEDDAVTMVFCPSVNYAVNLFASLKKALPSQYHEKIALVHYLLEKSEKRKIINKIYSGKITLIISPKSFSQGIDIKNVVRVFHYGLPLELKEFIQKEGRKGRRTEIKRTETIIYPINKWDGKILEKGFLTVSQWFKMPLEKTIFFEDNEFYRLTKGVFQVKMNQEIQQDDLQLLCMFGFVEKQSSESQELKLTNRGESFFRDLSFYEQFSRKKYYRFLLDKKKLLEPVSLRDVVEKFQPGAIDISNGAIVLDLINERILELSIEQAFRVNDKIKFMREKYYEIKKKWMESPNILKDIFNGYVYSSVSYSVIFSGEGLVTLRIKPEKVYWVVVSELTRLSKTGNLSIKRFAKIPYPHNTFEEYELLTYAYNLDKEELDTLENLIDKELDDSIVSSILSIMLAYLRLDERYALPIRSVDFFVNPEEHQKFVQLWERNCSAILKHINWEDVSKKIKETKNVRLISLIAEAIYPFFTSVLENEGITIDTLLLLSSKLAQIIGHKIISIEKEKQ